MAGVADSVYSGAATIGQAKAAVAGVLGGILVIALIISAGFSIMSTPTRTAQATATVTESGSVCQEVTRKGPDGKPNTISECTTPIQYTVGNQVYNSRISTMSQTFKAGDTLQINYNPQNPLDMSYNELPLSTLGWILSGIAIVLSLLIVGYNYLVRTYKPIAAYEGAATSIDLTKNLYNRIF